MSSMTSSTYWSDLGEAGLVAGGVGMIWLPLEFAASQILPGNRGVQIGLGLGRLTTTVMAGWGKWKKLGH